MHSNTIKEIQQVIIIPVKTCIIVNEIIYNPFSIILYPY